MPWMTSAFCGQCNDSGRALHSLRLHSYLPTPHKRATPTSQGFKDAQKIFMANRGIFEFGWWGRPSLCVAHTSSDVDACVGRFGEWLTAATG